MICLSPLPDAQEDPDTGEQKPLVLRASGVSRVDSRALFDHLSDAYVNGIPAVSFLSEYIRKQMLRPLTRLLRGSGEDSSKDAVPNNSDADGATGPEAPLEEAAEAAVDELLRTLAPEDAGEEADAAGLPPEKMDAQKVLQLLGSLCCLLEMPSMASKTTHVGLNRFFRKTLGGLSVF